MIKCSKGNVEIKGNLILLEAETVMILRRAWNYRNNGERSGNNTVGVFGIHESGV